MEIYLEKRVCNQYQCDPIEKNVPKSHTKQSELLSENFISSFLIRWRLDL